MLSRLWRPRPEAAAPGPRPSPPENTVVYAIGDIHGRADLLGRIYDKIRDDARTLDAARRVVVHLGDYVDRGAESREVIDLVMSRPLEGFEHVNLKGNHEDLMLEFLKTPASGPVWLFNGGEATLGSYRVKNIAGNNREERVQAMHRELLRAIPENHIAFLAALALTHREGDYFFVHAGIRPGIAIEEQTAADILWIRDEFLQSEASHGVCVVHGHTIVETPELRPNRIGIDTAAYVTGKLTCLALFREEQRILQT